LGEATGDQTGRSVSAAGDVNGDGLTDLLIGSPTRNDNGKNEVGAAYLVFGGTSFTTSLFPRGGGYLLPVKRVVQRAESVGPGAKVRATITIFGR
jgi:hypothetical protein